MRPWFSTGYFLVHNRDWLYEKRILDECSYSAPETLVRRISGNDNLTWMIEIRSKGKIRSHRTIKRRKRRTNSQMSTSEAETESNIRQFGSVRFDSVESNRTEPRFRQIRSNRIESNQVGSRSESNRTELLQSWAEPNRTEPIKSNPALTNTCSAASPPLVIKHIDLKDSLQSNFLFDQMNILRSLVRPPLSDTATWANAHQRLSVFSKFPLLELFYWLLAFPASV